MAKIKEPPFIKHPAATVSDAKMLKLMNQHDKGYQVYWLLNEFLQVTDDAAVTRSDLEIISERILLLPYSDVKEVIDSCVRIGLLEECTIDDEPALSSPLIDAQRAEMAETRKKKQDAVATREQKKREKEAEEYLRPSGLQFPTSDGVFYEPTIGKLREWSGRYKNTGECLTKLQKYFQNVNYLKSSNDIENFIERKLNDYSERNV